MSRYRSYERANEAVAPEGPYEQAIREIARLEGWKISKMPPLMTEPGWIKIAISRDITLECYVARGGVIDDNHWKELVEQAASLGSKLQEISP